MNKDTRIFVAGHAGLVGSAIVRGLVLEGYRNIVTRNSSELDLRNQEAVERFFTKVRPEYVFIAAAKVGGIYANNTYPATFMYDNLMIQCNVINSSHSNGVRKLLFMGSSCIYPRNAEQPMKEACLLSGHLEPTNEPYAIAKIAGIKLCQSFNRQYGTRFICVMPTSLYGPGDNYHPQNSHVLPALISRFHEAKLNRKSWVEIWGTGTPRREFLYVDDLAEACIFLMNNYEDNDIINIGTGRDISIAELTKLVKSIVGYEGSVRFNPDMPDGPPRKLLDIGKIVKLGWTARTDLRKGIEKTYRSFLENKIYQHYTASMVSGSLSQGER